VWQFFNGEATGRAPKYVFIKPRDRSMAPDFTLSDASGRTVTLSDFRGQVVLLNFWATWCIPCGAEIPSLMELQHAYRARGFQVVGVSVDEDGWKSVRPFIETRHVNYPVVIGNDALEHAYGGLESVPMTLIVDKSGRIAATHLGLCQKAEYEADIRAVLNE
jgi:cytochrome c biogenesis protein CcmG/thiol:disulfide interchange protein DsbE